jgi:chromosome segregation ATPase
MVAGGVLLYLRAWGKRHISEGKSEENDTTAHLAIATTVQAFTTDMTARYAESQERVYALSDNITKLMVENADAKARYEAETAAKAEMQAILLDRLEKAETARLHERRELEDKIGRLSQQMLTMTERQAKLESELERYREQHEKAERENGQLKAKIDELENERATLQIRVNDQQRQITALEGELTRLKAEMSEFYATEAILVENADGTTARKRDTGKLTPPPEPAA